MIGVFQGVVSAAGWNFWIAWVLPTAIAVSAFRAFLLPRVALGTFEQVVKLGVAGEATVLSLAAVVGGFVLKALSVALYRLLEGYVWPQRLRAWGVRRQLELKKELVTRTENAKGLDLAIAFEKLHRYPASDDEVAPTRLGNAIRAFETYGVNHFGLDSQTWWGELFASAPEALRKDYEDSRSSVDFAVNAFFLTLGFGLYSLQLSLLPTLDWALLTSAIVVIALSRIWYLLAVVGTSHWALTVKATVNLGRGPLARSLGLSIPSSIEDERRMWSVTTAFVYYDYDEKWAGAMDEFRATPKPE